MFSRTPTEGTVTKHDHAGGLHIAENRSGIIEYYHQDHLGSTRLKTNSTGGTIFSTNYVPFGIQYDSSGSEAFKYTGKHEDTSGLYYFGARYYDPDVGRFITEDPVRGSLTDPQMLNRYIYCRNNPLRYTDPDGSFPLNIVIGGIAGALIGAGVYLVTHLDSWSWPDLMAAAASGGVSGMVMSMGGPAASMALNAFLTSSASAMSFSTEVLVKGVMGDPVEPQEPIEIAADIVVSSFISFGVNTAYERTRPLRRIAAKTTDILSKVPLLAREVDVFYSYPQNTDAISNIIGRSVPPRVSSEVIRRVVSYYQPESIPGIPPEILEKIRCYQEDS